MLTALIAAYGVVGLAVFPTGPLLGRRSLALAALPFVATFAWVLTQLGALVDGRVVEASLQWVPQLGLEASLRLDAFGALMMLAVSGIGIGVLAYTWYYSGTSDPGVARTAGLLTLFAGAMVLLVSADNLLALFTGWELTSVTSYLLIGNKHTSAAARAAALHALLVTAAGGLVMLAGLVLIGNAAGTYSMSAIFADPPTGTTVTVGLILVAIGAFSKSAQYPLHSWLPGAMAAPTPVSAYLHSATMVKAGVYLLARFAPVFAAAVGPWRPVVLTVGGLTMIFGGLRALKQYDLKLLLAFGTVSQLGLLVVLFGAGDEALTAAGVVVLIAHVLFKAALFMVVGIIDHQTGTRDIRLLPDLGAGWGWVKGVAVLSAASMAGIPLLPGFIGKEAALTALGDEPLGAGLVLASIIIGSTLTVAYSIRFIYGAFVLPRRLASGRELLSGPAPGERVGPGSPPVIGFAGPAVILTLMSLLIGVVPAVLDNFVSAVTAALVPEAHPSHLALWHGFNLPLLLTVIVFVLGIGLFAARRTVTRIQRWGERFPTGTDIYLAMLQGLNIVARRTTAIVQNGTLVIYAGTVLLTAAVLPGIVLIRNTTWPGWPDWFGRAAEIPVTMVLVGAALLAAAVRRRFTAVLFLSMVGYAMSALFVLAGAPDLALTQAGIETLSTVLFVLVLRRLPDRFERRSSALTRSLRVAISATVAVFVFGFAITAREARVAEPVSTEMLERSLPDGYGRNVVNVILVDFRAFDTMGEITVLAAAAIGAVALARAGRRPRGAGAAAEGGPAVDAEGVRT